MTPRLLTTTALLLVLTGRTAAAQCPYQHPASAKSMKASLGQAFFPCGDFGDDSNTTTETGTPAC
jgi:hypothetical protein